MQKRWVLKPANSQSEITALGQDINIRPILANLLLHRNITSFEQAKDFFRPSLSQLHDPFLMKDMDLAIQRIEKAIQHKENILIYGDYDVDGTTAVAVVYSFFKSFYKNISFYIPDRYIEGYGVSMQGIDYASAHGYSLIIALDCGIKALKTIAYARSKGIDFIVGDHHQPGDSIPEAAAVLDPKRADCSYPYKELSGCGIGFKIVQAYVSYNKMDPELAYQYLDLVAISIASDIVDINGENRVLAFFGLRQLNESPRPGIYALIKLSSRPLQKLTIGDIIFQIGPRINAAGRIKHAKDAVHLLISKDAGEAKKYSQIVDDQNTIRKGIDIQITEEALNLIQEDSYYSTKTTTVLFQPHWHKGVIGIVASRLIERHYRPTIILTQTNGHVTGSARSIEGLDMYLALNECRDLLHQFGGHTFAAGLTMPVENVLHFQQRFDDIVQRILQPQMLQPSVHIESEIRLVEIDSQFYRILKQFEPFGPTNPAPVFTARGLLCCGTASIVGSNHLKFSVKQSDSAIFDCIGFGLGEYAQYLNSINTFDMCFTIDENNWRGNKTIQLNVKAIQ